ncbi:MAG: DUF3459 domain-containing protein, partial [Gemmatimonadetes bacterium]|nr:DUF3459 domain-containing protein [Gemmatimonadota bacterium]
GAGAAAGTAGEATAPVPGAPGPDAVDVTFRFQPVISGIQSCHLVGEFNGWDQAATPMTDPDGDGMYECTVKLSPGKYAYKFLVDGVNWLEDPNATDTVDDGYGGVNSLINVGESGASAAGKPRQVRFAYAADGKPAEVSLAGTFNNWTVGKTVMTDDDGDGTYEVTMLLPEDTYQYKFVVDGDWITDRSATDFVEDGFGGQNSVLVVDGRFSGIELALGDGKIFTDALQHRQTAGELNRVSDDRLTFTVKTYQNDVETVAVHWRKAGGGGGGTIGLEAVATDPTYQYWRGSLVNPAGVPDLDYEIVYSDGGQDILQNGNGTFVKLDTATENLNSPMFAYSEAAFPRFTTPDWVRNGVIYQIFPERFANGDRSNDPDFKEEYYDGRTTLPASGKTNGEYYHLVEDWNDFGGLAKSPYRTDGKPDYFSFYGGDIAGLREKLDYLEDLGITIIYFNPLFQARSNHKYEAYDYLSIDPHFGTEEEFKTFVKEAHARGIRIVADWVINHIGDHSPYFQDTVKNGKKSPYWDWFEWNRWPLPSHEPTDWTEYYECWWGFAHMPDLNFDLSRSSSQENGVASVEDAEVNQPVVDYILESARWWLEDLDIDGFRLDVPNEVPFWVWKIFRDEVRSIKPDAYLVGEIWSDAGDWVSPDCFDATMNYKYFKDPVTDFVGHGRIDAARFDRALQAGRMAYPEQASQVMMNLIDSHDTPRYLNGVNGDLRRLHLTALFAMTYVGAPHIYYGDEIAMTGGADPDCRRPFRWNWKEDRDRAATHAWYRSLIHLRKDHPALSTGDFRSLVAQGPLYAFARTDGDDEFIVVLNVGKQGTDVQIPVGALGSGGWEDVLESRGTLSPADGTLTVDVDGVSGVILKRVAA